MDLDNDRFFENLNVLSNESFIQDQITNLAKINTLNGVIDPHLSEKAGLDKLLEVLLSKPVFIEIFKLLPVAIQIADNNGIIKYINRAYTELFGHTEKDRIGKSIFELTPEGALAAVLRTNKTIFNFRRKDIYNHLISNASLIVCEQEVIGALGITYDEKDLIAFIKNLREKEFIIGKLSEKIMNLGSAKYTFDDLIYKCPKMENLVLSSKEVALTDTTVLISGETGTGKEIIANAIHNASRRAKKQFVSINCSAIPKELLESEFFGHEKGAFTGATKNKIGKFELASGGTLFLDEIGDMDLGLQTKILKAIEEKNIQRVGGVENIPIDIRIISATNRDLENMAKRNLFRQDLYFRLNVFNIEIPPLRERKEDLEYLAQFIINKICKKLGKCVPKLSDKAFSTLYEYDWPGNIRELENVLERAIINCRGSKEISIEDLNHYVSNDYFVIKDDQPDSIMPLEKAEIMLIKNAIKKHGSSYEGKREAAKTLGISLATLYNKINKYKIEINN